MLTQCRHEDVNLDWERKHLVCADCEEMPIVGAMEVKLIRGDLALSFSGGPWVWAACWETEGHGGALGYTFARVDGLGRLVRSV